MDITVPEAVEVSVAEVADPAEGTKVVVLPEVGTRGTVPVKEVPQAADMLVVTREVPSVHDTEAIVLLLVDTKEVDLPEVDTKVVDPMKEALSVHNRVEGIRVVVLLAGTKVVTDLPAEADIKEAVLSRIDSEAEQRHSVESSDPELLGLPIVLPMEVTVLSRIVQNLTENVRNVRGTKKELMKLLVTATMPEEPRKLGQLEKRKIFSRRNPL